MKILLLMIFSMIIVSASAEVEKIESLTTTDGKVYNSVTVMKVTPAAIRIIHKSGATSIPLEKLSPELQKKYNYNPEKSQSYKTKVANANRAYRKKRSEKAALDKLKKSATSEQFIVIQILNGGLLVNDIRYTYVNNSSSLGRIGGGGGWSVSTYKSRGNNVYYIVGFPKFKSLNDGAYIKGFFYKKGNFSYTSAMNTQKTVAKYIYVTDKKKKR